MAAREVRVPDIGNYPDVPVIEVLVAVGDIVKKDQGLVTLESDKATMEVPAPFAGVVKSIKVKVGDSISEGGVVAEIEESGERVAPAAKPAAEVAPVAPPKEASAPAKPEPERVVAPVAVPVAAPRDAATATQAAAISDVAGVDPEARAPRSPPVAFDASAVMPASIPHASPAVRLFARELGADLKRITGTGRKARITKEDVQAFVKQALAAPRTGAPASGGSGLNLLPWPNIDFAKFGVVESKPLSKIKKISGANLARNWAMIPHVTQNEDADITEMEAFRKATGEQYKDVKVTPLVFLIRAAVAALKKFPSFNASLDASGENLILKKYFHIGIAVDTPEGLVVPVIRDADQKGLIELAQELGTISGKARDRKLSPADMSGGCFTISSLGGIGGTGFTPIINAPEVAILGVTKAQTKPVWNGHEFAPRLVLPLSLSYDHRVIDGAEAARFAAYLAQVLGDIRKLLL